MTQESKGFRWFSCVKQQILAVRRQLLHKGDILLLRHQRNLQSESTSIYHIYSVSTNLEITMLINQSFFTILLWNLQCSKIVWIIRFQLEYYRFELHKYRNTLLKEVDQAARRSAVHIFNPFPWKYEIK